MTDASNIVPFGNSQSSIRVLRAIAHYRDPFLADSCKRRKISRWQRWKMSWSVAGFYNPVPDILAAIDHAIADKEPEGAALILEVLAEQIEERQQALRGPGGCGYVVAAVTGWIRGRLGK
jgi:hypothetical protein